MSTKSNDQGRAFEYACIIELKDRIDDFRPVIIDENTISAAKRAWELQAANNRQMFIRAAGAFVDTLFEAEPL